MSIMLCQGSIAALIDMSRRCAHLLAPPDARDGLELHRLIHSANMAGTPYMGQLRQCVLRLDRARFHHHENDVISARAALLATIDMVEARQNQWGSMKKAVAR